MDPIPLKSPWKAYLLGVIMLLSMNLFGFSLAQFNTFFSFLMDANYPDLRPSDYDKWKSLFNTGLALGTLFFCFIGGYLVKHFSRKSLLLSFSLLMVVVSLLQPFLSLWMVVVTRFVVGVVISLYLMFSPLLLNEVLPQRYSGLLNSCASIVISCGLQLGLSIKGDWAAKHFRLVFWYPVCVELTRLVLFYVFFNIESPRYIFFDIKSSRGRSELRNAARGGSSEQLLEGQDSGVSSVLNDFKTDPRMRKYLRVFYHEEDFEQVARQLSSEYQSQSKSSQKSAGLWRMIWNKNYRKQVLLSFLLNAAVQFSGINIITFYSFDIFSDMGFEDPGKISSLVNVFNILGSVTVVVLIANFGRKTVTSSGILIISISYFINMIGDAFRLKGLVLLGFSMVNFGFGTALGGSLMLFLVEMLPSELLPITCSMQWILNLLISFFSLPVINAFGVFSVYSAIFFVMFFTWFVFQGLAVESKGYTLSQMTRKYAQKSFWD